MDGSNIEAALFVFVLIAAPSTIETGPLGGSSDTEMCEDRMYGVNCNLPCPPYCVGNCNRYTGFCHGGCNENGRYGDKCGLICLHCNNLTCYHFDGNCILGVNQTYVNMTLSSDSGEGVNMTSTTDSSEGVIMTMVNMTSSTERPVTVYKPCDKEPWQNAVYVMIFIIIVMAILLCLNIWPKLSKMIAGKFSGRL